jgi:pSer/pThr/pTyr-binding forkhead associated (FHA) protein
MILEISRYSVKIGEVNLTQDVPVDQLSNSEIIIGRSDQAAVVLTDRMVSREHALLKVENFKWKVVAKDGSISVNGAGVNETELQNGDSISVGPFSLTVRIEEAYIKALQGEEEELSEVNTDLKIDVIEDETVTKMSGDDELGIPDDDPAETPTEEEVNQDDLGTDIQVLDVDDTEAGSVDEGADFPENDEFGDNAEFGNDEFGDNQEFSEDNNAYGEGEYSEGEYEEGEYSEGEYGEEDYGGDYNDDYAMAESDDDGTKVLSGFADFYLEILGEHAPYDRYNIDKQKITIGRHSEKCDIVLNDPEVSSVHASISKIGSEIELEDMQSGNGTLLNGERINKKFIQNGDEFVIGGTSFTLKIKSSFLKEQVNTLMPVEENQEIEVEEIIEVSEDDENFDDYGEEEDEEIHDPSLVGKVKRMWNDPEEKKKLLIGGVIAFGALMFWPTGPKKIKKPKKKVAKVDEKNKQDPKKLQRIQEIQKIAEELVRNKKYDQALRELEQILALDKDNNEALLLKSYINKTLKEIAIKEQELRREEEKRLLREKVKKLVEQAKEAVKERNVSKSEGLFQKIAELDPDNFDLPLMKNDLNAWKQEQERKAVEAAQKKAERERQVKALDPGKKFYLRKEWYKATLKLESFLELKGIDDDLIQSGTKMLRESRDNLARMVTPLIGKARSLKEGQDLKGAYEVYNEILELDPTHRESLNEMNRIRDVLYTRSKKVYREAIVSESLSLFDEAKEKFQEVQQISPSDGKYYRMATDKLKEYID